MRRTRLCATAGVLAAAILAGVTGMVGPEVHGAVRPLSVPPNAIAIHPAVAHVGLAQSGPPSTSECERNVAIA